MDQRLAGLSEELAAFQSGLKQHLDAMQAAGSGPTEDQDWSDWRDDFATAISAQLSAMADQQAELRQDIAGLASKPETAEPVRQAWAENTRDALQQTALGLQIVLRRLDTAADQAEAQTAEPDRQDHPTAVLEALQQQNREHLDHIKDEIQDLGDQVLEGLRRLNDRESTTPDDLATDSQKNEHDPHRDAATAGQTDPFRQILADNTRDALQQATLGLQIVLRRLNAAADQAEAQTGAHDAQSGP